MSLRKRKQPAITSANLGFNLHNFLISVSYSPIGKGDSMTRSIWRYAILVASSLIFARLSSGQKVLTVGPRPEIRNHVDALVRALNTGSSDEWEKTAQEHFSPAELKRHSVEARKQVFDNVRRDFGTISLRQVEGPDQPLRLRNAARYTLSEGVITVSAFHRDKETVVEAHNTRRPLTPDEIAHVFDHLYHADPSR